jgi:acetyltransferase-like isoleucine patch superfamily enzyme
MSGLKAWKRDEYGIYKFAMLLPDKNWVDVRAPPGYNATTNVVNITYCSNYEYNLSIYFEENLTNVSSGDRILIANNVYICANADLNDDITSDMMFYGIREPYAIDIINTSGVFRRTNTHQYVHVQFNVFIPFGTIGGEYSAHVATKIRFYER